MVEQVKKLFERYFGQSPANVECLPESGSARRYYRLWGDSCSCIGVYNENIRENEIFINFTDHFRKHGLHVPSVFLMSENKKVYLQQDLGRTMLINVVERERQGDRLSEHVLSLYRKSLDELLHFQLTGGNGLDFSQCLPRPTFDERCFHWDLNYFKYCFLRLVNADMDEDKLEDDFNRLIGHLVGVSTDSFLFRDFQSRNIMVIDDDVYFIDYQGGRRGALHYDVASLLYDAAVMIPDDQRQELLMYYVQRLAACRPVQSQFFLKSYYHFALMRLLQAMGAFGLRGLHERKQHFIDSIEPGLKIIMSLFVPGRLEHVYPEIQRIIASILEKYSYLCEIK